MDEIITSLDQQFLREFEDDIRGRMPQEKLDAELRQLRIARVMKQAGSVQLAESLGQKIATIDSRLFFRMQQSFSAAPEDTDWIDDMLADNPMLCAPGYKAKANPARHGMTYIDGKPVGIAKGRVQT